MKLIFSLKGLRKAAEGAKPKSTRANGAERPNNKAPTAEQGNANASQSRPYVDANRSEMADDTNESPKGCKLSKAPKKCANLIRSAFDKVCLGIIGILEVCLMVYFMVTEGPL